MQVRTNEHYASQFPHAVRRNGGTASPISEN